MTSSKNYDKIKPIIEELDKPVGQVLIKVLFAELTHTNNVDWGTEFSMLNLKVTAPIAIDPGLRPAGYPDDARSGPSPGAGRSTAPRACRSGLSRATWTSPCTPSRRRASSTSCPGLTS